MSREARINIENLYNARKVALDFFDKYTSRASEARRQVKKGTGLKILTPKQMLQILPIAFAQIKVSISKMYLSKEITKKVHNNIIKSIKV